MPIVQSSSVHSLHPWGWWGGGGRCEEKGEGQVLSVQRGGLMRAKHILCKIVEKGKSELRVWRLPILIMQRIE